MSKIIVCDGCAKTLDPYKHEVVIHGQRVNDRLGDGMPSDQFDWCRECAIVAFSALTQYTMRVKSKDIQS